MLTFSSSENIIVRRCLFLIVSFLAGFLVDAMATRAKAQTNELRLVSETRPEPTIRMVPFQEPPSRSDETRALGVVDLNLFRPLSDIHVDINSNATNMPSDYSGKLFADDSSSNFPGSFQSRLAAWEAPNIRYQPLYFQDVSLERYGYTKGPILQTIDSASYFGTSLILLPVNMVARPPRSLCYTAWFLPSRLACSLYPAALADSTMNHPAERVDF